MRRQTSHRQLRLTRRGFRGSSKAPLGCLVLGRSAQELGNGPFFHRYQTVGNGGKWPSSCLTIRQMGKEKIRTKALLPPPSPATRFRETEFREEPFPNRVWERGI